MKIEYIFIKEHNDFCNNPDQFISLLSSNTRINITDGTIEVSRKIASYTLDHQYVENSKEDVFHMVLESTAETDEDKVAVLETIDDVLRRINDTVPMFSINTIYDEVSMYYAKKLYPQMNNVENLLRKIIYLFMLKNLGSKWISKNVPEEMKQSIGKTLKKNEIKDITEDYIYYAEFDVLGWFFFAKYKLDTNYQRLFTELRKKENQNEEKIEKLIGNFEAKSNWDRYFSEKIEVKDLSRKWGKLYKYRNQVAHAKRISKKEYIAAEELINELTQGFESCLSHMNEVELSGEQSEAVEQVAQETFGASTALVRDPDTGIYRVSSDLLKMGTYDPKMFTATLPSALSGLTSLTQSIINVPQGVSDKSMSWLKGAQDSALLTTKAMDKSYIFESPQLQNGIKVGSMAQSLLDGRITTVEHEKPFSLTGNLLANTGEINIQSESIKVHSDEVKKGDQL